MPIASATMMPLATWPASFTLPIAAGAVYFCHATARNDTELFTARTAEEKVARAFAAVAAPTVVCGHTHMPFDRRVGTRRIVNAGSVGIPFGDPRAAWLLLSEGIASHRTDYARDQLAFPSDYPAGPGSARDWILEPPPAGAMLDLFVGAELQ